jgi:hypothetical protein
MELFPCGLCKKKFKSKVGLNTHVQVVHMKISTNALGNGARTTDHKRDYTTNRAVDMEKEHTTPALYIDPRCYQSLPCKHDVIKGTVNDPISMLSSTTIREEIKSFQKKNLPIFSYYQDGDKIQVYPFNKSEADHFCDYEDDHVPATTPKRFLCTYPNCTRVLSSENGS